MLKSTVIEPEKIEEKPLEFPLLARHSSSAVVLFTDKHKGTVVQASHDKPLGTSSNTWTLCDTNYSKNWEILPAGYAVKIEVE